VVLVHADPVETALLGVHELFDVALVAGGDDLRLEQARVHVDPDAAVLAVEVFGQLRVRHEVEPEQLHVSYGRRAEGQSPRPSGTRIMSQPITFW
jgi:hypothetical protein